VLNPDMKSIFKYCRCIWLKCTQNERLRRFALTGAHTRLRTISIKFSNIISDFKLDLLLYVC